MGILGQAGERFEVERMQDTGREVVEAGFDCGPTESLRSGAVSS